jgi:hypothetical protein
MLQIPRANSLSPFSIEILTDLYQKLSFPQRVHIFELFLPKNSQLPKKNPPYHSSIFSVKGNQIISSLCFLLGYYFDEWVNEPILGFLFIFYTQEKATTQFDYSQFLAKNIHEQFFKFSTEGMFRYSSILVYLFLFSRRQVLLLPAEVGPIWYSSTCDILDIHRKDELIRFKLQIVHISILPSSSMHAQWKNITKNKRGNSKNSTLVRPS